jgi:FkbM family methyltransferase
MDRVNKLKRRLGLRIGEERVSAPLANADLPSPPTGEAQRYFYLGPDLALARLTTGHMIYVDPQDRDVSTHLIAYGYWESWIHSVVRGLIRPGDRIVEVGANLGYYTLSMADVVGPTGKITALEASPRLAAMVTQSLEINGFANRVQVVDKAAFDRSGSIPFVIARSRSGGGHTQVAESLMVADSTVIEVEAVRLDDLGLGPIDFIRMDAEGSEPLILRGAAELLANPKIVICMEWSVLQMRSRASVPEFVTWLDGMGFKFWRIDHDASLTPLAGEAMVTLEPSDVVISRRSPTTVPVNVPEAGLSSR